MNKVIVAILALLLSINLTSCSSNTQEQNTVLGAVAGAAVGGGAGAFIGNGVGRAVAVGVGIVAGALVGGYLGNHMDSSDNAKMNTAMNNDTYKSTTWTNEKTGANYTVTPTSNATAMNGDSYCRTFQTTATIDGKSQDMKGTACQQADGSWKSVNA